jgi:tRNA(adenine34) deaminase
MHTAIAIKGDAMNPSQIEQLMREAQMQAEEAIAKGNHPFGAVLTEEDGTIVAAAHNTVNTDVDPTAHAEINLLRQVSQRLRTRRLEGYVLVSNAESCSMCMSAAIKAGIRTFYFGAPSEGHMNPAMTVYDIAAKTLHPISITSGILQDECAHQIEEGRRKLAEVPGATDD